MTAKLFGALLWSVSFASTDYSDCNWFDGPDINSSHVPIHPIGVCSAHSHEGELDGLSLYSTKYECNGPNQLDQFEYNNTDCEGMPFNITTFRKEEGYGFNCEAERNCPFTKIIFWELRNSSAANGHDQHHICSFDTNAYHEFSVVTNICIDLIEEYNISFIIDCTAKKITYTEYNDSECTQRAVANDYFEIVEGCDDPYDLNAYVQIAECEDAHFLPTATGDDTSTHHGVALIFTVIVGFVVVILVIAIGFTIIQRKNKENQVAAANIDRHPLNVDFQSIGDAQDPEPDSRQQVTTQGEDIEEIPIST